MRKMIDQGGQLDDGGFEFGQGIVFIESVKKKRVGRKYVKCVARRISTQNEYFSNR